MHRFLVILMIALLPLRSWAGDLMTVQMAVGQMSAVVAHATPQQPADCHGQTSKLSSPDFATASADETAESMTDGRCGACGTCQICHTLALAGFSVAQPLSLKAPSLLSSDSAGFASAPRALSLKPPIS